MEIIEKSELVTPENRFWELSPKVIQMIRVLEENADFEVIESRVLDLEKAKVEILIVDFKCASIKSKNSVGILNREPLAILYLERLRDPFHVAPIREDFPENIMHINFPWGLIPRTLCLYFESWNEIERSWTPQNFLNRIHWWMLETSKGTLHTNEQELERPYFVSEYQLLLPTSFDDLKSSDNYNVYLDNDRKIIKTLNNQKNCNLFILELDPIKHTRVFPTPQNLEELEEQFQERSSFVIDVIKREILQRTPISGLSVNNEIERTFILLKFQRFDNSGNLIEKPDLFAFFIPKAIGALGKLLGILDVSPSDPSNYYKIDILGNDKHSTNDHLTDILIFPVDIVEPLNQKFATSMSGISLNDALFNGILIGVGSLGSTLAEIWSKSGWGRWTLFDGDRVNAHNVFRHLAKEKDIGRNKAELVAELMCQNFSHGSSFVSSFSKQFSPSSLGEFSFDLKSIDLIVDASASSYLLRDLSISNELPRACSLFFNQTGSGGVLFLEDKERSKRLDFIELNYFRALVNEEWGENFLQKNVTKQRIGASCSDLSVVLSYEKVMLLSSSLSSLLRSKVKYNEANLSVLKLDPETGSINSYSIELFIQKSIVVDDWNIVYDTFIESKLFKLRSIHLPKETGGIVLGYIDQKIKTIYIVDITKAPDDSESTISSFVRGKVGLSELIEKIQNRTSGNCGYIGEWHSHPNGNSSEASHTDLTSLNEFANIMKLDGLPILMIIVGEDSRFYIK